MTLETDIKRQVREFYDQVGWQEVGEGVYQNARFEDLRPVTREYIHKCHLRVSRHLFEDGKFMLDAGSGPIQYPEYLDYSHGFQARVCVDISAVALLEARQRIGDLDDGGHGLFVVADIANLPFKQDCFDSVVSLHTIHHLPAEEHKQAYLELYRVLDSERTAVVVNGWDSAPLMDLFDLPIRWANRLRWYLGGSNNIDVNNRGPRKRSLDNKDQQPKGTYITKNTPERLKREIGANIPMQILVWRSVSVRFLRALVHQRLGGRWLLRILYWMEERFPNYFGENGQYPLIVIWKS